MTVDIFWLCTIRKNLTNKYNYSYSTSNTSTTKNKPTSQWWALSLLRFDVMVGYLSMTRQSPWNVYYIWRSDIHRHLFEAWQRKKSWTTKQQEWTITTTRGKHWTSRHIVWTYPPPPLDSQSCSFDLDYPSWRSWLLRNSLIWTLSWRLYHLVIYTILYTITFLSQTISKWSSERQYDMLMNISNRSRIKIQNKTMKMQGKIFKVQTLDKFKTVFFLRKFEVKLSNRTY